jgi:hypothetical protein
VNPEEVNQVLKWILSGATERDVTEAVTHSYPATPAAPLLQAAVRQIREAANFDPLTVRGWCVEATRDLYRRMVEIGDFTGALRAVKQLADFARATK